MSITLAHSDAEIMACYAVMKELRPHLPESGFLGRIREQQREGYHLAGLAEDDRIVTVAGFRVGHNLAWGRFLYVDDLVTLEACRSRGHGRTMLEWLRHYARKAGCAELHLDSGSHRQDAHRFYQREGMRIAGFHFSEVLGPH